MFLQPTFTSLAHLWPVDFQILINFLKGCYYASGMDGRIGDPGFKVCPYDLPTAALSVETVSENIDKNAGFQLEIQMIAKNSQPLVLASNKGESMLGKRLPRNSS